VDMTVNVRVPQRWLILQQRLNAKARNPNTDRTTVVVFPSSVSITLNATNNNTYIMTIQQALVSHVWTMNGCVPSAAKGGKNSEHDVALNI